MTICNDHDSEVCFESRDCPACALQAQLSVANQTIEELKAEIEDLKQQIDN